MYVYMRSNLLRSAALFGHASLPTVLALTDYMAVIPERGSWRPPPWAPPAHGFFLARMP